MKVKVNRLNMLSAATEKVNNRMVRFYWNDLNKDGDITIATFEVNWGCFGSTNTIEAKEFAEKLIHTCALVDVLNSLSIEIDYDRDTTLLSNRELYAKWYDILQTNLNFGNLIEFLSME